MMFNTNDGLVDKVMILDWRAASIRNSARPTPSKRSPAVAQLGFFSRVRVGVTENCQSAPRISAPQRGPRPDSLRQNTRTRHYAG